MREIKFRALDEECEWIYGMPLTHVEYEEKEFPLMRNCDETGYWGIKKIHPKTLGQYTGLKDKNGVEIYEGDIVETQQSDLTSAPHEMVGGIVEWDSKNAMYKIKPIYGSKFHPITMFVHDVVVVGNKFENPELLEREAE